MCIRDSGLRALDLWRRELPDTPFNGSLVVAHARERNDFERFAKLTSGHQRLDAPGLAELEPSLEGRFRDGLFFAAEGHVEPRRVLPKLHERIIAAGGTIKFNSEPSPDDIEGIVIDCRGMAARDDLPELRGVKGEMILIETDEVKLARPVRLIHPRWPLYVIPREDHLFMPVSYTHLVPAAGTDCRAPSGRWRRYGRRKTSRRRARCGRR